MTRTSAIYDALVSLLTDSRDGESFTVKQITASLLYSCDPEIGVNESLVRRAVAMLPAGCVEKRGGRLVVSARQGVRYDEFNRAIAAALEERGRLDRTMSLFSAVAADVGARLVMGARWITVQLDHMYKAGVLAFELNYGFHGVSIRALAGGGGGGEYAPADDDQPSMVGGGFERVTCPFCCSDAVSYEGIDDGGDYGDALCDQYHCHACDSDFEDCHGGSLGIEPMPPFSEEEFEEAEYPRIGFDDIPFDHGYGGGGGGFLPDDLLTEHESMRLHAAMECLVRRPTELLPRDDQNVLLEIGGFLMKPTESNKTQALAACDRFFDAWAAALTPNGGGGGSDTTFAYDVYPCPKCGEPSHFGEDGFYHCACGETFGFLPFSMDSEIAQTGIYAPLSDEIDTPIYGMPPVFHDECPNCYAGGYDSSKGCMFCNHGGYYSAGGGGGGAGGSRRILTSEQGCLLFFLAGLIAGAIFVYTCSMFFLPLAHYAGSGLAAWVYFIFGQLAALGGLNVWTQLKRIKPSGGGGGGGEYAPAGDNQPSRYALVRRAAAALGFSGFLVFGGALVIGVAGYTFGWVIEGKHALNTLSPFVAGFADTIIGRAAFAVWLLGALWMFFDPIFETGSGGESSGGGGGGGDYAPRSIIYRPGTPQQYRITQQDGGVVVEYGTFGANDSKDTSIKMRASFTAEDHPSAARVFEDDRVINFPAIDRLIFHMHFPQFSTMQKTGTHVPRWGGSVYRIGADDRGVLIVQIARGAVARIERSKFFPVCEYAAAARAFNGDSVNDQVIDYLIFRWKKELKEAAEAAKPTGGGGGGVYAPTYSLTEALSRLTAADDALYAAESSGAITTYQRIKLESDLRIAMTFYRQALGLGVVR